VKLAAGREETSRDDENRSSRCAVGLWVGEG
jgi:hypothetical protein